MSIVLDGTAGITTPEITSSGGPLVVNVSAPDNSVVVNASGNVGVGTSDPTSGGTNALAKDLVVSRGTGVVGMNLIGSENRIWFSSNTALAQGFLNYNQASNFLEFGTNNIGRMRIDSSGNVGVGYSSPFGKLSINANGAPATSGNMNTGFVIGNGTTGTALNMGTNDGGGYNWFNSAYINNADAGRPLAFFIGGTERARIDSSGSLLVGTTSASVGGVTMAQVLDARTRNSGFGLGVIGNASNTQIQRFYYNTTAVGSINVSGSATNYSTSSDYRLKHDITPMTGALARVAALKPCTYKWNADDSAGEGFIAHELQEVVPDCVTGKKDAVDAEGNPQYQGIDTSFLVATLTAAIQEQQAIINAQQAALESLTARVVALDARLISLEGQAT